jgi:hypothetical protein
MSTKPWPEPRPQPRRRRQKLPRSDPMSCDPLDPRQMAFPFGPQVSPAPVSLPATDEWGAHHTDTNDEDGD